MYIFSFEKLEVWQNARMFILDIYKLTSKFPSNELFGITSQIKRSSSSIATNIAEGTSRNTNKDKAHFLTISYSSAMETLNHLIISKDLNYVSENEYLGCREKIKKICNQINSLKKYYLSKET
ncbi:four helix bundle protein [Flavobacterium pectinovorum]|uniref:Four helix bundle protein n=1 Tax=Flavobacterium pectinovorum TaxID=29533 RepID=A0AB36P1T9_9FLAO|nr:four helix bundle protein [Flavobacterium pectinovorum]OXB05029.1 four helix bundle protein [Flavobacterium pectinovorum]SHL30537.1 four helix bundle protein [Flavobacterium pectinovorum]